MVKKPVMLKKTKSLPKLVFRSTYHKHLKEILEFSADMWGKRVATEFYLKIKSKLILLPKMPTLNPKCRFIDSTETKTYRNIIVRKYFIVYSVKSTEITVIDIIHQSVNPENMKNMVE